jgi:hypothetical protein
MFTFKKGNNVKQLKMQDTNILAFFRLNRSDPSAREYKYNEIYFALGEKNGSDKIITRMYVASPKDVELFHLRLL